MTKRYTPKPIKSNYVSFEQINFNNKTENKQTAERTKRVDINKI